MKASLFRNHDMLKNSEGAQNQEVIPRSIGIDKAIDVERFDCNPMKRFTNQRMKVLYKETWCLQKGQRAFQASTTEGLLELVKSNYSRLFVLTAPGKLSSRVEDRDFRVKPVVKELIEAREEWSSGWHLVA